VHPSPDAGACYEAEDACEDPQSEDVQEGADRFEADLAEGVLVVGRLLGEQDGSDSDGLGNEVGQLVLGVGEDGGGACDASSEEFSRGEEYVYE